MPVSLQLVQVVVQDLCPCADDHVVADVDQAARLDGGTLMDSTTVPDDQPSAGFRMQLYPRFPTQETHVVTNR